MMPDLSAMMAITSLQNPRVKAAIRLQKRRERNATGKMLVEGFPELELAVHSGARVEELFFCESLCRPEERPLLTTIGHTGAKLYSVSAMVMQKMAYRENPSAWLAVVDFPRRTLASLQLPVNPLLIVAEAVEKPGNLGAILRSADAAGVHAVIVCDPATDLANPNVVRASKGALFHVPVVEADAEQTLAWLRQQGIRLLAATPAARHNHWQTDLTGPVAIAVGAEDTGLSDRLLQQADLQVLIPMVGQVNSLNVAQALTLLVYEAVRQRQPA